MGFLTILSSCEEKKIIRDPNDVKIRVLKQVAKTSQNTMNESRNYELEDKTSNSPLNNLKRETAKKSN